MGVCRLYICAVVLMEISLAESATQNNAKIIKKEEPGQTKRDYRAKNDARELSALTNDNVNKLLKNRKWSKEIPSPRPPLGMRDDVIYHTPNKRYGYRSSAGGGYGIPSRPTPSVGQPWPLPQIYQTSSKLVFQVDVEHFSFLTHGYNCDILDHAMKRIRNYLFVSNSTSQTRYFGFNPVRILSSVNITISAPCGKYPHLKANESYRLEVKSHGIFLHAPEVWGALWGLETLSQILYRDDNDEILVNQTHIEDWPRFAHRGVMLDTSRHFVTKKTLIENLEAMAQNKMNVFHWHIVDEQAFPYQSTTFPDLSRLGAYDPVDAVYTPSDVQEVIEEARLRGIRVVPEFDTPGHMASWGFGVDNLLTPCYIGKRPEGYYGPINPALESSYAFIEKFFREVLSVFPDMYVHLGGDEIPLDCWATNPTILKIMEKLNISQMKHLVAYYENRLIKIIQKLGREKKKKNGYILWQDALELDIEVNLDAIVQVWIGGRDDIVKYVAKGHRVIFSSCWYLNVISYGMNWHNYYECSDLDGDFSDNSLVLGGETALWTEYIGDNEVMPKLWPRACAIAERLWSAETVKSWEAAAPRIEEQRCRMLRRGMNVDVLSGPGFCKHSHHKPYHPVISKIWEQIAAFSVPETKMFKVGCATSQHLRNTISLLIALSIVCFVVFICILKRQSNIPVSVALLMACQLLPRDKNRATRLLLVALLVICLVYALR